MLPQFYENMIFFLDIKIFEKTHTHSYKSKSPPEMTVQAERSLYYIRFVILFRICSNLFRAS